MNRTNSSAMYAEVHHVEKLSPDVLRVVLTGGTLDRFEGSSATDAYVNARFPPAGSPVTVPFSQGDLDEVAADLRPRPRRFTIRHWAPEEQKLSIDFVAHGDAGYAGSWAQRAEPGDRLQFEGPGGSYRPSHDVDWHLLVGDESAIGAIGASLQSLEPGARALVFAVVERRGYEIELPTAGDVAIQWLYREDVADAETWVADAIAVADFPLGTFDVFVHGEAGEVRAVRRHLAVDRGLDLADASISPYWRRRHTDEDWRKVKRRWMADQAQDA
ncbi:MAG: siderophore-interacting protein [Acidimicrobiales bacterium]